MPTQRRTHHTPDLGHETTVQLPGRPLLSPGVEATVDLPGSKTNKRVRFARQQADGTLTFVDKDGRFRTITEDRVITIHRDRKTRT